MDLARFNPSKYLITNTKKIYFSKLYTILLFDLIKIYELLYILFILFIFI